MRVTGTCSTSPTSPPTSSARCSTSPPAAPTLGRPLAGQGVALIFEKPSTRTRHSMEMAVVQLGGHPVYTRGEEIGFDVREPVEDVARIIQGYHALIAARVFDHERARADGRGRRAGRQHAVRPVASAAGARRRADDGAGARPAGRAAVAWVGDYNNVARSLGESRAARGTSASPARRVRPDDAELERFDCSASVGATHRPEEAVAAPRRAHRHVGVDGSGGRQGGRKQAFEGFTVDAG